MRSLINHLRKQVRNPSGAARQLPLHRGAANHSRKEAAPPFPYILKFVAKGVTALCLLRPYLPLTRLMRKSEPPRAILLRNSGGEENQTQSASDCWVFLKLTTFSFISLKEKV